MDDLLNRPPIRPIYNDRIFRTIISIPVAFYMMLYREKERWFEALFDFPNFWIGIGFSYLTCLLLLWLINRISGKLDKNYRWRTTTVARLLHQFTWGFAAPTVLVILLVSLFFGLVGGVDIRDTEYFTHDFPLVLLLILVGNLYYLAYYLWVVPPPGYIPASDVIEYLQKKERESHQQKDNGNHETNGEKQMFMARTKEGIVAVPQEDIAAIFRQGEYVLLRTFNRETFNLEQSLTDIIKELNGYHFFKINPRNIVNYRICTKYKHIEYGKLELELAAPMNSLEVVSRSRAREFIEWMER